MSQIESIQQSRRPGRRQLKERTLEHLVPNAVLPLGLRLEHVERQARRNRVLGESVAPKGEVEAVKQVGLQVAGVTLAEGPRHESLMLKRTREERSSVGTFP